MTEAELHALGLTLFEVGLVYFGVIVGFVMAEITRLAPPRVPRS